jgi:superfamily II DNA or RNA helicase
MNLADSSLTRLQLFSGVPVSLSTATPVTTGEIIERLQSPGNGLWHYRVKIVDTERVVAESELYPLPADRADPLSMFRANVWQSGKSFHRRQSFLRMLETWNAQTAGIPSLMGVRIEPMGHQLYAMRRVLSSSRPRFILADEVGLGKTIETGLILQAFMQERPQLRILIIAPGSMSRQWFSEMYLRFGARAFGLLEAEDLLKRGDGAKEFARSRLADGRVVASTTALMASSMLLKWIVEQEWDVVVLDEAHRISAGHQLYPAIAQLASRSSGFLALSATPSIKELGGLSSLLALVAPEAYQAGDTAILNLRIARQKQIWEALNNTIRYLEATTRESAVLDCSDFKFLSSVWEDIRNDPVITDLVSAIRNGSSDAVEELVAYVQEFHRIDQRLIRTRRATLTAEGKQWPKRRVEVLEYEPSNAEINLVNHLEELAFPENPASPAADIRLLYERICCISPSHASKFLNFRRKHLETGISPLSGNSFERLLQDPEPGYEWVLQSRVLATTPPLQREQVWLARTTSLVEEWAERDHNIPSRFRATTHWIQSHLAKNFDNKVLVFCQEADVVVEYANFLRTKLAGAIETFHYQMPEDELSKVAHRFQRVATCRVLVSDELGGEGRNFQVATAVVHLDTPWSVSRIEQRIGRLDRIARPADRDVLSVVVIGPGDMERTIVETFRDVFRVYEQSIGGLEFGLPAIQKRIFNSMRLGATGLRNIQDELRSMVSEELSRTVEAFDGALDSSKRQLAEGAVLAKGLMEAQHSGGGSDVLLAWAEHLGFRVRRESGSQVEVLVDPEWYRGPRDRLPSPGRKIMTGTFKHNVAMENDSLQYFGPGHTLIDFLVREFEIEGPGRCAAASVVVSSSYVGRIFVFITLRCAPHLEALGARSLSPAVRLRVLEQLPSSRQSVAFELLPHEDPPLAEVSEDEQEFVAKLLTNSDSFAPLLQIWNATATAIPDAVARVRLGREHLRQDAARRLEDILKFDRKYLTRLAAQGSQEALDDLESFQRAILAIEHEMVAVDSLYLVLGVGAQ